MADRKKGGPLQSNYTAIKNHEEEQQFPLDCPSGSCPVATNDSTENGMGCLICVSAIEIFF